MKNFLSEIPKSQEHKGIILERIVTSLFQINRYYTDRRLVFKGSSTDLFESDIIANSFYPLTESLILVECKSGTKMKDLLHFIGVREMLNPTHAFLVIHDSDNFDDLYKIASDKQISIIKISDLVEKFNLTQTSTQLRFWYWSNLIDDRILSKEYLFNAYPTIGLTHKKQYNLLRKQLSELTTTIWQIKNPFDQINYLEKFFEENKNNIRAAYKIIHGLTCDNENAINTDPISAAFSYVNLKAKVYYIVAAIKCANTLLKSPLSKALFLKQISNERFSNILDFLISNSGVAFRIPFFLQYFLFIFGGMYTKSEIGTLAKLTNERDETINSYFEFIKILFQKINDNYSIQWAVTETYGYTIFNNVPPLYRGFSMLVREELGLPIDNYKFRTTWLKELETMDFLIGNSIT